MCHIRRRFQAMPQYHVGHQQLVAGIQTRAAQLPNFALAGNAFSGVGIPHCIRSGESAAESIIESLSTSNGSNKPLAQGV